ncbi:MAG: ATP-binding protein [Bacteroidales bacterium]|jgi:nitrogen fixation/metabolism regulation signal transduction histidine kinase|nr:ATP-binding protein [Bacteroidales bacterium]
MKFKNFRLNVVVRVLLIAASVVLLVHIVRKPELIISTSILVLILLGQIVDLLKYVERTNKRLTVFLESIRHSDFVSSFSDQGMGRSFDDLNKAFNEVIEEFRKTRAAKEEHFNYLQTVVQHVSIGILVFRRDGKVDMINNALKRMFRMNNLRYIDEMERIDKGLAELLRNIKAGDSELLKVFNENELMQLSIRATEFRMRGDDFVLVSMQNIHNELEAKEMDSWQRLIRVLTHEIMNSITPIVSLSGTVKDLLIDQESLVLRKEIDEDDVESAQSALSTIEKRSQGLLNFVQVYRNLTRIPKPNFRYFEIRELFDRVENLLQPKIKELNVKCEMKVIPPGLMLTADPDLIEQVLINLLINSIHAVKERPQPQITMVASTSSLNRVLISITDNGYGIKPDTLEKIFVPFFTSKKEGSGIGLSLSREIMRLHKGNITVKSKPEVETVFTLHF